MKKSCEVQEYQCDAYCGLFLWSLVSEQKETNQNHTVTLNKSHLCFGEVNERQRRSYLGYCFPLETHKWVETVHALWLHSFMKQTRPIWFCEAHKTNRIYCKHFLNHGCSGEKKALNTTCLRHAWVFLQSSSVSRKTLWVLNIGSWFCVYFQQHDQHDVSYYCMLAATAQFTQGNH